MLEGTALRKNIQTLILFCATIGVAFGAARSPLVESIIKSPDLVALGKIYLRGILLVIGFTVTVAYRIRGVSEAGVDKINRLAPSFFYGSLLFFTLSLLGLSIFKLHAFHYYADLANNLEILWRQTHGLSLTSPMFASRHHGLHWFAAHFAPIAYIIAYPWFQWFPYPHTLFILETLALASGAIPIALYARERLGPKVGYWIGAAYLLYPTLHYTDLYDFGFLQFCIPCLAWAFYFLHKRRFVAYSLAVLLALICREEVGLTVFLLGLYTLFIKKERWLGLLTAFVGMGYSLFVLTTAMPSFRTDPGLLYLDAYNQFGSSVMEIIWNLVVHPWKIFSYFLGPIPLGNLVLFFLPLLFLSLGTPSILLIGSASFVTSFVTGSATVVSFMLYYFSASLPFLFFAATDTIKKMKSWQNKLGICLFASAISCLIVFGPSPISASFFIKEYQLGNFHSTNFHYSRYRETEHYRLAHDVIALVPPTAIVAAEQAYLPYLFNRQEIRVFPCVDAAVNYVLIDRKLPERSGCDDNYLDFRARPEFYYQKIESDSAWKLVKEIDGISLYERPTP